MAPNRFALWSFAPAEVRPAQVKFPYFTMLISRLVQCVYSLADAPEEFFVVHRFRKRFANAALNQKESPSGRNMRLADFVIRLRFLWSPAASALTPWAQ